VRRCQILQYPAQALARGSTGTLSLPRTLALLLLSVLAPSVPRTVPWREAEDKGHLFIHRPQGYSGLGNEPHTPVKEDNRTSNPQQTRYPGCAVEHAHHANADRGRHKQAQSEVETRERALNGWAWAASCRSTSVRRSVGNSLSAPPQSCSIWRLSSRTWSTMRARRAEVEKINVPQAER
jgi:hypothetical protein